MAGEVEVPTVKRCSVCHETKPLDEFEVRSSRPCGRGCRCKPCMANKAAAYYRRHLSERREYARKRHPERRDRRGAYKRETYWERLAREPEKERARIQLRSAVASGTVAKASHCEECGATGLLHGHHDDYSKPLVVVWLCRACHGRRHRKDDNALLPPREVDEQADVEVG